MMERVTSASIACGRELPPSSACGGIHLPQEGGLVAERVSGIWREDLSFYLTDLRHPLMVAEWNRWQQERGRRYNSPMPERERRDFDREMIRRYGEQCPPPPRAQFQLVVFDIFDRQEDYAEEQRRLAMMPPVTVKTVEVYEDEDL